MFHLCLWSFTFVSAGFSFGGILCYEVACQLIQGAEDVAMVTMLDTMPWFPKATVKDKNPDFQKFQDFFAADLKDKMVRKSRCRCVKRCVSAVKTRRKICKRENKCRMLGFVDMLTTSPLQVGNRFVAS